MSVLLKMMMRDGSGIDSITRSAVEMLRVLMERRDNMVSSVPPRKWGVIPRYNLASLSQISLSLRKE